MIEASIGLFGVIIGIIATVLSQYLFAKQDRHHQLRMAALDKRLAVHQEAYALWNALIHMNKNSDAAFDCQEWWPKNCLYLTPEASKAFLQAYQAAFLRPDLLAHGNDINLIEKNWSDITRAGAIIASSVGLPDWGELRESCAK